MTESKIKLYDTPTFTATFMPSAELQALFKGDVSKFLLVPVEEMYRHVKRPVPASRATSHTCIYLTKGEAYMKIGSEQYTIHQDEMLFVAAGQVFSFEEYNATKFNQGYLCSFHPDLVLGKFGKSEPAQDFEFLQIWGNPRIKPKQSTSRFIGHLFQRLLADYSQNGLNNLAIIQSYLLALLCEVNQAYVPLSSSSQVAAVSITNQFKKLVFANSKSKHLVADYASLLYITPNHLNKTVKAITGKSPTKWIDEAIVLEAKVLLTQSSMSVGEIASEVGFEDQSYFSRLFKRYEGLTPSDFRKKIETS